MKQLTLFDPYDYDIRKGIFERIRQLCDASIERNKFPTKEIAIFSIKKLIKN
jgi:hypothetical protein